MYYSHNSHNDMPRRIRAPEMSLYGTGNTCLLADKITLNSEQGKPQRVTVSNDAVVVIAGFIDLPLNHHNGVKLGWDWPCILLGSHWKAPRRLIHLWYFPYKTKPLGNHTKYLINLLQANLAKLNWKRSFGQSQSEREWKCACYKKATLQWTMDHCI